MSVQDEEAIKNNQGPDASAWGAELTDPVMVQHEGKLIAFARERKQGKPTNTLYFQVQDPQAQVSSESGEAKWEGWYRYYFPEALHEMPENVRATLEGAQPELRLAGLDLLTVKPIATAAEEAGEAADPTRVTPASAAFSVASASPYLYVFRSSNSGSLYLDRLVLSTIEAGSEEAAEEEEQEKAEKEEGREEPGEEKAPATYALKRAYEARYQGTGLRDVPLDETDRQSYLSKTGEPYYEPTYELPFVENAKNGAFSVCRVPTVDPALVMWYVAVQSDLEVFVWAFSETGESVLDFGEEVYGLRLGPSLQVGSTQYDARLNTPPSLAFYAEQDPATGHDGREVELLRAARLMLACGARSIQNGKPAGPFADTPATFVYDFPVDNAGRIAPLMWDPNEEDYPFYWLSDYLEPADGEYKDGKFHPWDHASYTGQQIQITGTVSGKNKKSVYTATLLGQVNPQTDLNLRMGDDGLVHLYYDGPVLDTASATLIPREREAMVAHFDPRVSRVEIQVPEKRPSTSDQLVASEQPEGYVRFVAREAGPGMRDAKVEIEDASFGSGDKTSPQPDLCTVAFTYPTGTTSLPVASETWLGVPRDVETLAQVLNGGASGDAADPAVQDGTRPFFDVGDDPYPKCKWLARLPLGTKPKGDDERPRLTLVSARGELPLFSAAITDATDGKSKTLTLEVNRGAMQQQSTPTNLFTLTYSKLPNTVDAWPDILSGADAEYDSGSSDASLFTLNTDGGMPLLLYSLEDKDLSQYHVGVSEDKKNHGNLQLTYRDSGGTDHNIGGLFPNVTAFAKGLEANTEFNDLFGISTGDLEDAPPKKEVAAITTASSGPLKPRDIAQQLLYVVKPGVPIEGLEPTTDKQTQYSGLMWRKISGDGYPPYALGFYVTYDEPESSAWIQYKKASSPAFVNRLLAEREDPAAPATGAWLREQPQPSCAFDGTNSMPVPFFSNDTVLPRARNLRPQREWTLEAWVKSDPESSGVRSVLTYGDKTPVPDGSDAAPQWNYRLGLKDGPVVVWQDPAQQTTPSYFMVKSPLTFPPPAGFTWGFWVARGHAFEQTLKTPRWIVQVANPSLGTQPYFAVGLDATNQTLVIRTSLDGSNKTDHTDETVLQQGEWAHVAVTGNRDPETEKWTLALYINGERHHEFCGVALPKINNGHICYIGSYYHYSDNPFVGKLVQLRYWGVAKTDAELRRLAFRSYTAAAELIPNLIADWYLNAIEEGIIHNRTGVKWEGILRQPGSQQVTTAEDNFFLSVLASVGGEGTGDTDVQEAMAMLPGDRWNHLALVYSAGGALRLNMRDPAEPQYVQAKGAGLQLGNTFAIHAWIRPEKVGYAGGIVSQWAWHSDSDDVTDQSYRLEIDSDGYLVFTLGAQVGIEGTFTPLSVKSDTPLFAKTPSAAVPIAVTFHAEEKTTGSGDEQKTVYKYQFLLFSEDVIIGSSSGEFETALFQIQASNAPLSIGQAYWLPEYEDGDEGYERDLFHGTIGPVSLWDRIPKSSSADPDFTARRGLVAEWNFREGQGRVAADAVGGNDAILTDSGLWISLRETAQLRFYANGVPEQNIQYHPADTLPPLKNTAATQLILGVVPKEDSATGESPAGLAGQIAQVTLWGEARGRAQITGQARLPLAGDEPGLLAGWNFRNPTGENKETIVDITGGQNDGTAPSVLVCSNAPITREAGAVTNVYSPIVDGKKPYARTEYAHSTTGRIAVGSYVDIQNPGTPEQRAVLRRSYLFDAEASPVGGGEVGAVDLIYLGQVQTDPKLIGFIEGAPPLPSENLTRPYYMNPAGGPFMRYLDTSTVTLKVQDSLSLNYTASVQHAAGINISGELGVGMKDKLGVMTGSPGAYVSKPIGEIEAYPFIGYAKLGTTWSYSAGKGYSAIWNSGQSDTQGTNGDWEPKDDILNPDVGRRFQPLNDGLAVVESLTADLFAMIFHATGGALGTIALPNPAIPPDRNLVLFPMDTSNTRQGTLDGKVGLVNDPAYQNANAVRGSYFKPAQAYALAARIEQQHARDQAYAADLDMRNPAGEWQLRGVPGHLPATVEESPDGEKREVVPRSGIVNRYVWTAGGGLDIESQSYAGTASKSYQGTVSGSATLGAKGTLKVVITPVAVVGSLDLNATYSFNIQAGRSEATSANVQLDINAVGEAYLRKFDPEATGEYGGKGAFVGGDAPGKVPAYRFMSYYLPPDKRNSMQLNQIVDPVWLKLNKSPTARLMRQMTQTGNVNPAWRILHRVTYVERIPPAPGQKLYTAEKLKHTPVNLPANAALLDLISGQLNGNTSPSYRDIVEAVYAVMNPAKGADGKYPLSVLGEDKNEKGEPKVPMVSWWEGFLKDARSGDHPRATKLLHELTMQVIRYCSDGYRTGVLPFEEKPRSSTLLTFNTKK